MISLHNTNTDSKHSFMDSDTSHFGWVLPMFIFALRMEVVRSSEAVVPNYQTKQSYDLEYHNIYLTTKEYRLISNNNISIFKAQY
jgi:hypothetical protein